VLDAPVDVAPVEMAVVLADASEEVFETELSDLEDDSAEDLAEAAEEVEEADEADEDDEAAEVAAAPVPLYVRTAVWREPTSPLATHVPATDLLVSYAPTIPASQQNPLPIYPAYKFQDESAHLGAPSTSPRQSLAVETVSKTHNERFWTLTAGAAGSYFIIGSSVAVKGRRAIGSVSTRSCIRWLGSRLNRPALDDIASEEVGWRNPLCENGSSTGARSRKQQNGWETHLELDWWNDNGVVNECMYEEQKTRQRGIDKDWLWQMEKLWWGKEMGN
jgi:hypothetical protein